LGTLGLAYLHCVEGQTRGANDVGTFNFQALRRAFGGAYIANNGYSRSLAIAAIEQGRADLVAFGQSFIANPDLVTRLEVDAPLAQAPPDVFYGGGARGYTDWPSLSEAAWRLVR